MNRPRFLLCAFVISLGTISAIAAGSSNWAGEYANKDFLNGKAVFQLGIEEGGGKIQVSFDAVHNDGHGCAPEAAGPGKIAGKDKLEFKWEDSSKNAGTGTITRAGDGIVVSLKTTRVVDSRCLDFYKTNISLKRVGKK